MELYINPTDGLCNRLRALGCAMWISDLSDRDLILGWKKWNGCNADFNQLFISEFETRNDWKIVSNGNCLKNKYIDLEDPTKKLEIKTNHVFSYKGGPEIWTKEMWFHVSPYIQSITPISEIQEAVDEFAEKNNIKDVFGVHVRRTDNPNSKKYSKIELFFEELDKISSRFFLCSDCKKTKDAFRERYKDRCITFKHPTRELPNNRSTVRGMKLALCELLLLSKTINIIGSVWSSYGTMAAVLGGNGIKRVSTTHDPSKKIFRDQGFRKWNGEDHPWE